MFVQVISGKVKDADLLKRQNERWIAELKPGTKGYLGATGGITPDGRSIMLARFESQEVAESNSGRAEQDAWWNETEKAFDGEVTFLDCTEVDTPLGGGSNDAKFVQVIQGRAKDPAALRSMANEREAELRKARPDILGMIVAWHGDGRDFTQAVYFKDEQSARAGESETQNDEMRKEYEGMFDGEPTFYDLTDLILD